MEGLKLKIINVLAIASISLCMAGAYSADSNKFKVDLFKDQHISGSSPIIARFKLPEKPIQSAKLILKAYNSDPNNRQSVDLKINGVGGEIAYTIANNITDGFIPPKQTRTWIFDLNKNFETLVKRIPKGKTFASYKAVQDTPNLQLNSYKQILNRSGEHIISCSMNVPGSIISMTLEVDYNIPKTAKPLIAPSIDIENSKDIRMTLARRKLVSAASDDKFNGWQFVAGIKNAEKIIGKQELSDIGSEGYLIKSVKNKEMQTVVVTGTDTQGIAYGIIRLARLMNTVPPEQLESFELKTKPSLAIREVYEEHGWAVPKELNTYKVLLNRYFEEGINTMDLPVGWFISPDYYLKGKTTKDLESIETVKKVIEYAHSLGIKVYIVEDAYLNPLYNEKPENITNLGNYELSDIQCLMESGAKEPLLLCLENPVARDLLKRNREYLYDELREADGFVIYFGDPGGCYHEKCLPHGEKIVQYLNEIYVPIFQAVNPEIDIIVTLWGIGLEDTEYVVKHIEDLPKNVIALQIPPTSMVAGSYLTFEKRRGELIREAGEKIPVIIQQFYEGVGFKNGWVDLWEHPMPREMNTNFRGSWMPDSGIIGNYGSPFDISNQLINLRIGMEWGWNPGREASDIIKEFADEQFGIGTGEYFTKAIFAMNDYWSREVRRFHFDQQTLSKEEVAETTKSLNDALTISEQLDRAERYVTKNRLYFKSFTDLASLQMANIKYTINMDNAVKLSEEGASEGSMSAAKIALDESEKAIRIVKQSERYEWLMSHPWWNWWDIAKRPEKTKQFIMTNYSANP